MSAAIGDDVAIAGSWLRQVDANARATLHTLLRPPRRRRLWEQRRRIALGAVLAVAVVAAVAIVLDPWSLARVRSVPAPVVAAFSRLTYFGLSGWFLWPTGLLLLAGALFDSPRLPRFARLVLAAWSVRLGFVFIAIGGPGLFVTIVKRLIGRARPFVDGSDVWSFHPIAVNAAYASFPSGHATTAFAALVAIGALLPQARALLWVYAIGIAVSRVVVMAHHPSDVVTAAMVGALGALLVRHWFAVRRLGFAIDSDGAIRAMPGPSLRRIGNAIARCWSAMRSTTP